MKHAATAILLVLACWLTVSADTPPGERAWRHVKRQAEPDGRHKVSYRQLPAAVRHLWVRVPEALWLEDSDRIRWDGAKVVLVPEAAAAESVTLAVSLAVEQMLSDPDRALTIAWTAQRDLEAQEALKALMGEKDLKGIDAAIAASKSVRDAALAALP